MRCASDFSIKFLMGCPGIIQKNYIEQDMTLSVQQPPDRQQGRHTGLPLPTQFFDAYIPVGADLCVRPSVLVRLCNFSCIASSLELPFKMRIAI